MSFMGDDFTFTETPKLPASTDNYAAVTTTGASPEDAPQAFLVAVTSGPLSYNLKNTGANTVKVRVIGVNDTNLSSTASPTEGSIEGAEISIVAGGIGAISINPCNFHYYQLQVVSAVGGSAGALQVRGVHKRI